MNNINAPAGILVKTTLVDYPGRIACAFFFAGCNLRCPYCYNHELVKIPFSENLNSIQDLYSHLEKRRGVISGLTLSGGEALLNPETAEISAYAKNTGYKVKIDTNGLFPERLDSLIKNKETRPDFIAMDLKTTPDRAPLLSENLSPAEYREKTSRTIEILKSLPEDSWEIRTVLVPPLVSMKNIKQLSSFVPENASWQFANFLNENCLNPDYCNIQPYTDSQAEEIIQVAKKHVPKARLR